MKTSNRIRSKNNPEGNSVQTEKDKARVVAILRSLHRHVWNINGMWRIKVNPLCSPSRSTPAILCLNWKPLSFNQRHIEAVSAFETGKREVMRGIREMLAGVCDVQFIGKNQQQPLRFCRPLEGKTVPPCHLSHLNSNELIFLAVMLGRQRKGKGAAGAD